MKADVLLLGWCVDCESSASNDHHACGRCAFRMSSATGHSANSPEGNSGGSFVIREAMSRSATSLRLSSFD